MSVSSTVLDALAERGWAVTTSSLPGEILAGLADEARSLWNEDLVRSAGIGRTDGHTIDPGVRSDSTHWIKGDRISPACAAWLDEIEMIRNEINRSLYLGLENFEAHFAVYPPGARYHRHIDRFSDASERTISCLLYLNESWQNEDGGALRLHLENGPLDVIPTIGTMVLFRSESIEHEVLPSRRERFSLSGWYRRGSLRDVIEGRGILSR